MIKAIALFSGGLDSMLAIKLITQQNIEVEALYINTGFGGKKDITETLKERAKMAGASLRVVDIREEYIQKVLFNPKYGYGKYFNPCIDCHGYMFKVAKSLLKEMGASFIITGEVVGQRPMSQRAEALKQVLTLAEDREERLILRPLSAKLLEPTKPEIKGWVDRERLLDISGRSRERQLKLAKEFGWRDYESPAGGCLLTQEQFSKKVEEFIKYDSLDIKDIELLKFGRHFRLRDGAKLVVGKSREDNENLKRIDSPKYMPIRLKIKGPFSLIDKNASLSDKKLASKIALTYAKSDPDKRYEVYIGDEKFIAEPFSSKAEAQKFFY
jgi:tRNA-specific 2-thiouridylase